MQVLDHKQDISSCLHVPITSYGGEIATKIDKTVTHIVFQEGDDSVIQKSLYFNIPLVTPLWVRMYLISSYSLYLILYRCIRRKRILDVNKYKPLTDQKHLDWFLKAKKSVDMETKNRLLEVQKEFERIIYIYIILLEKKANSTRRKRKIRPFLYGTEYT